MIARRTRAPLRAVMPGAPPAAIRDAVSCQCRVSPAQVTEIMFHWGAQRNTWDIAQIVHVGEAKIYNVLHACREMRRAG